MAMYTGTFSSMADLLSKFLGHLGTAGFSITAADATYGATVAIPGAGGGVVTITADTYALRLLAGDSGRGTLAGAAGTMVNATPYFVRLAYPRVAPAVMSFPGTYWLSIFDDPAEVWLIVEVDGEYYLRCGFGRSDVSGIVSHGAWVSATCGGGDPPQPGTSWGSGSGTGSSTVAAIPFDHTTSSAGAGGTSVHYVRSGFEGRVWDNAMGAIATAYRYSAPLLNSAYSPNAYNGEPVLLPVNVYCQRASSLHSLCLAIRNLRHMRIDNYTPKDIITLGHEDWIVFPGYRKSVVANPDLFGANESSGFVGFALRYEL